MGMLVHRGGGGEVDKTKELLRRVVLPYFFEQMRFVEHLFVLVDHESISTGLCRQSEYPADWIASLFSFIFIRSVLITTEMFATSGLL